MKRTLKRHEWDFGWCPESELPACCNWEYLRELIECDPGVASQIIHPFLPMKLRQPGVEILYSGTPKGKRSKLLATYFPSTPYSDLPPAFRKELHTLSSSCNYTIPKCSLHVTQFEPMPHTWVNELLSGASVLTVAIDWRLSPDALTKRFREIVETNQPQRAFKRSGKDRNRKLKAALKQLGARRILRSVDRDMKEARKIALSLYGADSAWMKANTQASEALNRFRELHRLPS